MDPTSRQTRYLAAATAIAIIVIAAIGVLGQVKTKPKPRARVTPKATPTPTPTPNHLTTPQSTDPSKCTTKNGLRLAEINELIGAHNAARTEQQLPAIEWSCSLAELAQEWANKSIYEHRDNFAFGENIFVSGSSTEPVASVVRRWMLEKPNWNNDAATCTAGKVCTHYAQIMWRSTKTIGCGINRSATGKWKSMVVCNYDPASLASAPAW